MRDGQRRLVAALTSLVAAVRARVLDRGTCDLLADRRAAAAARRELAGHFPCAQHMCMCMYMWRNEKCWPVLEPRHHELLHRDVQ